MTKKVNSIQFLGDKVVIDYSEGNSFQFCKRCKNGNHFRFFLHHFCPQLLKHFDDTQTAVYFERRFYFMIHHTAIRHLVMQETLDFIDNLQWRFSEAQLARKQKRAEKKLLKKQNILLQEPKL